MRFISARRAKHLRKKGAFVFFSKVWERWIYPQAAKRQEGE